MQNASSTEYVPVSGDELTELQAALLEMKKLMIVRDWKAVPAEQDKFERLLKAYRDGN